MEIMSAYYSCLGKTCGLGCSVLFSVSGLLASDIVLQKVPPLTAEQAPAYPQNLARHRLGAQVEVVSDRAMAKSKLLSEDPAVGYSLPSGKSVLLISLARIENIDSISFLNDGARGNLTIATASAKLQPESPQWHQTSEQQLTSDAVKTKIGPTEAKYVKLTFDVNEPGHIGALGVYSTAALSDFTMPRSRKVMPASQNVGLISYANIHEKSRTAYVSSGSDLQQANNMIDEQPATTFTFATDDPAPTAVVDLGKSTALRRISAICTPQKGKVSFYVLQSLPGVSSIDAAPATLRLSETAQQNLKPVGSVTDDGSGRVAIDFPTTSGRYVMIKWNGVVPKDASFSVAEIAAFGGGAQANLMAANAGGSGGELIESDGKTIADGKDAKDFKETPAEGPAAPAGGPFDPLPPHPPFNFVPLIVPASE
jgi:hypothetical protein